MRFGRVIAALGLAAAVGLAVWAMQTSGVADDTPEPALSAVDSSSTSTTAPSTSLAALPDLGEAPELTRLDGWLQSDVTSLGELRGRVVVVQFWTFGCFNCKNTLPRLRELAAAHGGDDFEIVGVHAPEFEYEKDPEAIAEAAERLGVTWPIALDTDRSNFRAWQGRPAYWPRTYVIDRDGTIRFDHIGEGAYDELADVVARLLAS